MKPWLTEEAPALIGVGAETIVARARDLGLTWTLRPATVQSSDSTVASASTIRIAYDGDNVGIPATNLSGAKLYAGQRVMGLIVPPGGNYILGPIGSAVFGSCAYSAFADAGTTTSATYVDMPGPKTATFTKLSPETNLLLNFHATFYTTAVVTSGIFALKLTGPTVTQDSNMGFLFANAALSHGQVSGTNIVANLTQGAYTVTARWARWAGTGVLTQDVNDWVAFSVVEIP